MGSETVKDTPRLRELLAYLWRRALRRVRHRAVVQEVLVELTYRIRDELDRRQGSPPG